MSFLDAILTVETADLDTEFMEAGDEPEAPGVTRPVTFKASNATRWDSLRVMVMSFLDNEDGILKLLVTTKIKSIAELLLTQEEIASMKELYHFLDIFSSAIRALQSSSMPTSNLLALTYFVIKTDLQEGAADANIINKVLYNRALANLDKRLQPTKLQLCAAILDPTSCNVDVLWEEMRERFNMSRTEMLESFIQKYNFDQVEEVQENSSATAEGTSQVKSSKTPSFKSSLLSRFSNRAAETSPVVGFTIRDEIAKYFEATLKCDSSDDVDILIWWKNNEKKFPRLAMLSKLVLGCPATSAAAESAFSTAGCVVTARRSHISPFKVSDILFVKDNYSLLKPYF